MGRTFREVLLFRGWGLWHYFRNAVRNWSISYLVCNGFDMSGAIPKVWAVSLQTAWYEYIGTCSAHEAHEVYEKYVKPLFVTQEHRTKARRFTKDILTRGLAGVSDISSLYIR